MTAIAGLRNISIHRGLFLSTKFEHMSILSVLTLLVAGLAGCSQAPEKDASAPMSPTSFADDQVPDKSSGESPEEADPEIPKDITPPDPTEGKIVRVPEPDARLFPELKRLHKDYDVWIDQKNKRVVIQSEVCQRDADLEVFACIHSWLPDDMKKDVYYRRGTKEHEAVLTINSSAALIHAALLAVGATNGSPAKFPPTVKTYEPATGDEIEIMVYWKDQAGKQHKARAQEWIRDTKTMKEMDAPWVFAGSVFWTDEQTGKQHYGAEAGEVICVSNFANSLLDLPIESSEANDARLFESFRERIPPPIFGFGSESGGGGAKVTKVEKGSPAEKAGLKVGDVIVSLDYQKIGSQKDLEKVMDQLRRPGTEIVTHILRDGNKYMLRILPDGAVVTLLLTPKPKKSAAKPDGAKPEAAKPDAPQPTAPPKEKSP